MFTKYGYFTIGIVTIIFLILFCISIFLVNNNILKYVIIIIGVLLLAFTLYFFRDPERNIPTQENVVLCPADGKVLFVKNVVDTNYIKGEAIQISIFMSPLNVHVNRIPLSGVLTNFKYHHGKYLAAFQDKASTENERAEYFVEGKNGKVLFTQVAGFVARRLVIDVKKGESVKSGERFGMIKFGSRVDVVVPASYIPKVKQNDKVTAGETILFEIK